MHLLEILNSFYSLNPLLKAKNNNVKELPCSMFPHVRSRMLCVKVLSLHSSGKRSKQKAADEHGALTE